MDSLGARYPAVTERKSIELSRAAHISVKKPGRRRGSRGKTATILSTKYQLRFRRFALFSPVASGVGGGDGGGGLSHFFLVFPCSAMRLLKTPSSLPATPRLSSFCISRVPDCRLRQRTKRVRSSFLFFFFSPFFFSSLPLARSTRVPISMDIDGIAFKKISQRRARTRDWSRVPSCNFRRRLQMIPVLVSTKRNHNLRFRRLLGIFLADVQRSIRNSKSNVTFI